MTIHNIIVVQWLLIKTLSAVISLSLWCKKCPEISRLQDTRKPDVIIPTLAIALEFLLKNALFDRFLFIKSQLSG